MKTGQYIRASIALGADLLAYVITANDLIYGWYEGLPEETHLVVGIVRWGLISFFSLVVAYYTMIWLVRKKLMAAGTHNIECNFTNYYNYKIANRSKRILKQLHKAIYHETYNVIKEIEDNSYTKKDEICKSVRNLLGVFRNALNETFNLDVSVGIMLVKEDKKDKILQNYQFVPSSKEQEIGERSKKNYILNAQDSDDITDYVKKSIKYAKRKGSGDYFTNSAFDFVLSTSATYWMSNNLDSDIKNALFYSSSDNLDKYYRSMAVFAIIPPAKDGETDLPIEGLLSFDSRETGIFSEIECKLIMGYMAHCIYEIFKRLNYEKR